MGFYVHLDDTRSIWIQCRYERMFRICKQCGCLGHVAKDCKRSHCSVQASVAVQKEALRQRFDAVTFMDLNSPLFINEAITFRKFKGRRTTKIWVEVENDEVVYHTYEFSPIRFTRTNPSSSSSPLSSNVYRVSDGSSSDSGSSSSPPSSYHPQAEDPHAINDDMEEDPLTPEGYYSGSFGQDSQGGAASNSPHSINIPSPINWELLATESARWQHATEGGTQAKWREETENRNRFFFGLGDELQILVQSSMTAGCHAQRVPQAQMEDNLNTDNNHHASPLLAQLQEQVATTDVLTHQFSMQQEDVAFSNVIPNHITHAQHFFLPPNVWAALIDALRKMGSIKEAQFQNFVWAPTTSAVRGKELVTQWLSKFFHTSIMLGLLAQYQQKEQLLTTLRGLSHQYPLGLASATPLPQLRYSVGLKKFIPFHWFITLSWAAFLISHWTSQQLQGLNSSASSSSLLPMKRRSAFTESHFQKRLCSKSQVRVKHTRKFPFPDSDGSSLKKFRSHLAAQHVKDFSAQGVHVERLYSVFVMLRRCLRPGVFLIVVAQNNKELLGVRFARRGPVITHMMYVDDTILFFKADDSNCAVIKATLDMYGNLVGQRLNSDKSFLVFSPNTPATVKDRIAHCFGVSISAKVGKYLGTYVDSRMSDTQNYRALVEKSLEVIIFQKPGYISLLKGRFLHYSEAIISRDVAKLLSSQNVLVRLSNDVLLQHTNNFDRLMPQYVFTGTEPPFLMDDLLGLYMANAPTTSPLQICRSSSSINLKQCPTVTMEAIEDVLDNNEAKEQPEELTNKRLESYNFRFVFLKAGTPSPTVSDAEVLELAYAKHHSATFVISNVLSIKAEAGFDIRVPPTADPESLEKRIAEEWAPASRNMTFSVFDFIFYL
ncbi:aminoacylase-1 isoform X1 [Senna tora]|uniref:Aminoacylase-1 isoform X1 n=1 Tax=Senna tora TaxID=362788 RepID=A0A834W257_9FABA|nr:aminoacylase-1 isoform X1 [Senna tora]